MSTVLRIDRLQVCPAGASLHGIQPRRPGPLRCLDLRVAGPEALGQHQPTARRRAGAVCQ